MQRWESTHFCINTSGGFPAADGGILFTTASLYKYLVLCWIRFISQEVEVPVIWWWMVALASAKSVCSLLLSMKEKQQKRLTEKTPTMWTWISLLKDGLLNQQQGTTPCERELIYLKKALWFPQSIHSMPAFLVFFFFIHDIKPDQYGKKARAILISFPFFLL